MIKVMVVEDSLVQRKAISSFLKSGGAIAIEARDGAEAIALLETQQPHLILLDAIMPRMNGYEVCRRIKSNPKTQHIPIVMCTGQDGASDRYWAMKQGADAYLVKPFRATELIALLKQFLRPSVKVTMAISQPTTPIPTIASPC
jgi:twitching motility two-component system response regulator PilH